MNKQAGFTLIELVLVIVILGILAATALPRFSNLAQDARVSTLQAIAASLKTGATVAHAMQQARGLASNIAITYEGTTTVTMAAGYPQATTGGIDNTLDPSYTDDFTLNGTGPVDFRKNGAPNPATCFAQYPASVAGAFPQISITSSGC